MDAHTTERIRRIVFYGCVVLVTAWATATAAAWLTGSAAQIITGVQ